MEESKNMLIEAETLYKNGLYSEVTDKCTEIIKTGENLKEAYFLWAKAYLFMLPPRLAKEYKAVEGFCTALSNVASNSKTFEEVFAVEAEIGTVINEWERKFRNEEMSFILENPSLENWNIHTNTWSTFPKIHMAALFCIADSRGFKKLREESGENVDDLRKKYGFKADNEMTDEEKCDLYFSSGYEIFEKVSSLLEEYKNVSAEAWSVVRPKIAEMVILSTSVIEAGIKEDISGELEKLKKYAEVLKYIINAQVFPNGKRVVLLVNPDDDVNKLKKTYERIKELDGSFVIPEIVTPEPTSTDAQSGGCYVATAVYGSYDCPQVWTLRRFRDDTLAKTIYGRLFIKIYYAISPILVKWFGKTEWFKKMFKNKLDRMVDDLNENGVKNTPYEEKTW